jgi:aminoglycoside phosphotransferase (APT) family kinase protein
VFLRVLRWPEIRVDAGRGVVIKRFRSWDRGEPAREWSALMLLAEHAPGLAPIPVRAGLTADPPVIEMSRLPGAPLGGTPLLAAQADALALALKRLWNAVPPARLTDRYGPGLNVDQLERRVTAMLGTRHHDADDRALVRRAWKTGADWLSSTALDSLGSDADVVLGQGDCNLANFLWDGTGVRIVDFEDSGPSDRAFELAVLVEHISAWSDAGLSADAFLARFDLTAAEQARMLEYRRLSALFWLIMLLPGSSAHHRNPPGTLERQATRLLLLLGREGRGVRCEGHS